MSMNATWHDPACDGAHPPSTGEGMSIDRRDLLKAGRAVSAIPLLPRAASAEGAFALRPGAWRRFEVTMRLEIVAPAGATQAWIPIPSINEAAWFRSEGSDWNSNAESVVLARDPEYGAGMLHVTW